MCFIIKKQKKKAIALIEKNNGLIRDILKSQIVKSKIKSVQKVKSSMSSLPLQVLFSMFAGSLPSMRDCCKVPKQYLPSGCRRTN